MYQHYPFVLEPLPYAYDALEPIIDKETLHYHHDKHFKAYTDNLNRALQPYSAYHSWSLEQLILQNRLLPRDIRKAVYNNAGGVYNHALYFNSMSPHESKPLHNLESLINRSFGSCDAWRDEMSKAAISVFGSGWTWLVSNPRGALQIVSTANQDTPLPLRPILLVDVWEHAYYLQYKNLRADYVNGWFSLIDWEIAEKRLNA